MQQIKHQTLLVGIFFSLLVISCERHPNEPLGKSHLNIVEAEGYVVPKDSMSSPKIIPVGQPKIVPVEQHKVVSDPANLYPVDNPKVVPVGAPIVATPGRDSFSLPKIVPAIERPVAAGLPTVRPAKEVSGMDPNPRNFSSFNKLQGFQNTNVQAIIEDKNGNLWFGTNGGGVTKYDGLNFTTFTQKEGLGNNDVRCIFADSKGNLWFGTWGGGVTKYDGLHFTQFTTEEGLNNNYLFSILEDKSGNLWFGALENGVAKYDGKSFTHFTTEQGLLNNMVLSIIEDTGGNLWFGTDGGGVAQYDGKSLANYTTTEGLSNNFVTCIAEDKNNHLWFGTQGGGITKYDGQNFTHFTQEDGLPNNFILSIIEDKAGTIWFGNWEGGVTKYDGRNFTQVNVIEGFRNNVVQSILEDQNGNIWFGTADDGVSKYSGQGVEHFTKKDGLEFNVRGIAEDKSGNIWVGMYGGAIAKYDGENFTRFTEKDPGYSILVTSILGDKSGNIWFGAWGGGVTQYDGISFTHFTDGEGLSLNRVTCLTEDRGGNLWIGTDFGGVSKYDGKTFTHYTTAEGLSHNVISGIAEDQSGNLWFGTLGGGVTKYDGKYFTHFAEREGLSNYVLSIVADENGALWFGTQGDGVIQYDGKNFTHFTEKEGLSNNTVQSILEDQSGNLWFGTGSGLSELTRARQVEITEKIRLGTIGAGDAIFKNYSYQDGIVSAGLNTGQSIFEDKNNAIWVAAGDRLTVFHPSALRADTAAPNVQLTDVALFNENIAWVNLAQNKDTSITLGNGVNVKGFQLDSLAKWYNVPRGLSLAHHNNYLTFNYVGITLQSPQMVKYQYQLAGLEDGWSALTTQTEANYGNLSPGDYTFKVKAMNSQGRWSEELRYPFTIRPPWWRTWWAYLCYVAMAGGSLYAFFRYQLQQRLQQAEALRLKELDAVKTKLYTNITHEFRTPLTVILGMAQQVLDQPKEYFREGLQMIIRNGQNLLSLVNQLLDLSKLESGKLTLHYHRADIVSFLNYITESFHSLAENKGVQLHFIPEEEQFIMDFDEVRFQQIVSNLISNAVKFTPKGGHVYLSTSTNNDRFLLKIKDTGMGITEADLPHIFDRFYQSDDSATRHGEGTGIGLALTRELVKLMEGRITVKSFAGKGAEFTVALPIRSFTDVEETTDEVSFSPTDISRADLKPREGSSLAAPITGVLMDEDSVQEKPLVLIADDNEDVRAYLTACLRDDYAIELATNGQECEEIAFRLTPDLIVLDVMMPIKDGFAVCKTLKTDERTSHIPIIMLTAKADLESKLEGLEQGADDYLTKPFNKKELLLRTRNLLELRRQLQQYYRSSLEIGLAEEQPESSNVASDSIDSKDARAGNQNQSIPLANSLENAFVIKVRKTIEAHLDDTDFTIAKLCRLLAMSHSQVHRKLSALTGLSATHFMRYVQLVKAKELLRHSGFSIAAIGYDCGFNNPSYFSRVFKQEFGVTPQEWRNQNAG